MCAQNSILGSQILVLDEQFLVDEAGNVREQAYPFALFHLERPEIPRLFNLVEFFTHGSPTISPACSWAIPWGAMFRATISQRR